MSHASRFLKLEEVLEIHQDQTERYGGDAGIRDLGLLQSAVAMPQATFGGQFLHEDLYAMASAYLYHIVQNHPFLDGNKRTGTVAALVLEMNDVPVDIPEPELVDFVLLVATGNTDKPQIARFLREHAAPSIS